MAAAASAVIIPALAKGARSAAGTISEALTADLAVVRWSYQPRARRKVKPAPIDMELHVNPAAIGVAAVGVGLTMWLLQLRAEPRLVPTDYGRWEWVTEPATSAARAASEIKASALRGTAPTRPIYSDVWVPEQGHWEKYSDESGKPQSRWVVDVPGHYEKQITGKETADWYKKYTKNKKTLSVERRPGFSMTGLLDIPGLGGGDEPWYEKWPFLWWL